MFTFTLLVPGFGGKKRVGCGHRTMVPFFFQHMFKQFPMSMHTVCRRFLRKDGMCESYFQNIADDENMFFVFCGIWEKFLQPNAE